MGRKRQEGVTTYPRFTGKAYAVAYGIFHGNERFAERYAEALTNARATGYGPYKVAWEEAKAVLDAERIPSALHGLYKAFVNEVVNKVQRRKEKTLDEIVDKWTKQGLDPRILRLVGEAVVQVIVVETPKSAKKGA